jgi:hypothetical protein
MIWTTWLLVWIFGGGLPIVTIATWVIQKKEKKKEWSDDENRIDLKTFISICLLRSIASLLFGLCVLGLMFVDTLMIWAFLFWWIIWAVLEAFIINAHWGFKAFGILALIGLFIFGICVNIYAGYNNALYFDQFIHKAEGFPILNEIPNEFLRLTTEDLARSIAKQRMSEFGSNVEIVDMQITMYNGRLVWVALVAPLESWGATFKVTGMVIIDANDPDKAPEIVRDEQFAVADGLTFNPIIGANGNAKARGYFGIDTSLVYGDVYPVLTPENKWATAVTTYCPEFYGTNRYTGIYLLDKRGNVIDFFEKDIPNWLIQPFDEDGFLEGGINSWGGHRRGKDFDPFAGGFLWIGASNDRIMMTEDTRYIFDPDTNGIVAIVMVSPTREKGELSLAGAFKATSKGIYYYDLSQYNLMSGDTAGAIVLSKITLRGAEYFTEMELLYPLKVDNETKQVWFVPIYFKEQQSGLIGLAGLGLVDAQSPQQVIIEYTGQGITGASLVARAKESFRRLVSGEKEPPVTGIRVINGTLLVRYDAYMVNGTTHQWLTIATSEGNVDVLIKAELLTDAQMLKLQKLQIGSYLLVEIDESMVVRKISN